MSLCLGQILSQVNQQLFGHNFNTFSLLFHGAETVFFTLNTKLSFYITETCNSFQSKESKIPKDVKITQIRAPVLSFSSHTLQCKVEEVFRLISLAIQGHHEQELPLHNILPLLSTFHKDAAQVCCVH